MSLKIRETKIIELTFEEMNMILFCRQLKFIPAQKGIKFLKWIKDKMPYGQCQVIAKAGNPCRIERAIESELFDLDIADKVST